jgi:hypothetical protein
MPRIELRKTKFARNLKYSGLLKNIGIDFVDRRRYVKIFTIAFSLFIVGAVFQFGPLKIQEARAAVLSTILPLTTAILFATFELVNPPRAYFGRCGVLYLIK